MASVTMRNLSGGAVGDVELDGDTFGIENWNRLLSDILYQ